jgi:hypothetical protein
LGVFAEEIENRRMARKAAPTRINNTEQYDVMRNQARRFIRRGEKVLKNVAVGRFPGSF